MARSIVSAIEKIIAESCYQNHGNEPTTRCICFAGTPRDLAEKVGQQLPNLNDLIQALLINEESARIEALKNIDSILECKVSREAFMDTVESLLRAMKDYMIGVKELSTMLKMAPRDTDPTPAPTTERSIARH